MNKYLLGIAFFISFSATAASNDCKIAIQMLTDSGLIMKSATEAATGKDATDLTKSKVTESEFSDWKTNVFSPKITETLNKYSKYQSIESNSPIYLGNILIIESTNYVEALGNFVSTHDKQYHTYLRETMGRVGNIYQELKTRCGK
ncbi:hypothetical protein [Pectobacterium odoriferum]|uniref:hypothetical protein n=1 Tax=Pectobacterium odoriferum TaxID=78398 RepID=UPI000CD317F8|nr:hypothetical protein [Pectobacterium odoriferum]POD93924.1 hypothetical protein BV925_05255 [Pectobacterium odoriferum]